MNIVLICQESIFLVNNVAFPVKKKRLPKTRLNKLIFMYGSIGAPNTATKCLKSLND